ncbi:hypothetical protein B0H21DRAFT_843242 [Amylocystis lapponica]|nr:hypothetical protein B0H21DRAFT_843242 [Amylocystis lapponica]
MHRALDCDDILLEILEHLNWTLLDSTLRFRNTYLQACALVCKTISVLALNILWKDVDGVKRLFKMLPSFRWDEDEQCYKHICNASAGDMQRFKLYTDRIRVFAFKHTEKKVHSDSILQTVGWTGQRYMLPNLQSLTWYQCSPSDTTVMSFIVPSLKKLDFELDFPANTPGVSPSIPVLASLLAVATSLEELSLDLGGCNFPISPLPPIHVQCLRKVTLYLRWPTLALYFLRTLSRLETLTELTVHTYSSDWDRGIADIRGFDRGSSFSSLRHLHARGPFAHLSFVLSVTSSTAVDFLHLDAAGSDGDSPEHCNTFLTTLDSKAAIWSATLRTVCVVLRLRPKHGDWPSFERYTEPLRVCKGLRNLYVWLPAGLTNKDLEQFPREWPALVELKLEGAFYDLPSFPAVADMVCGIPRLRVLLLPCCIDNAGIMALQSLTEPASVRLESFDLSVVEFDRDVDVPQVTLFGELLERLFPRLDIAAWMRPPMRPLNSQRREFLGHVQLAFEGARSRRQSLTCGHAVP